MWKKNQNQVWLWIHVQLLPVNTVSTYSCEQWSQYSLIYILWKRKMTKENWVLHAKYIAWLQSFLITSYRWINELKPLPVFVNIAVLIPIMFPFESSKGPPLPKYPFKVSTSYLVTWLKRNSQLIQLKSSL